MKYAFRHMPRMPSLPATCCSVKSYSNTPKRKSSFPGTIMPSLSISPFTGTLISALKPSLVCVFVALNSAYGTLQLEVNGYLLALSSPVKQR